MSDQPIRACDQERERVADVLLDKFNEGRLTAAELAEGFREHEARSEPRSGDFPVQPLAARRRRRPYDRVLPVLFIMIVIAAAAGKPALAAALSVVFISVLACRIGYGGRW